MLKVGLTGGLACGKSFVARELERLGAHVIHADELGHAVLAPDGEVYGAAIERFGPSIVDGEGRIDRRQLAAIVFRDPAELAALNALVHPAVLRREASLTAAIAAREPDAIVVTEAAILIETGLYRRFDRLIVVFCSAAQQVERALERRGATRADVEARILRQMPVEEKLKIADEVIDTSGTEEATLRQTHQLFERLSAAARKRLSE